MADDRGPKLEQIEGGDPTFRVEVEYNLRDSTSRVMLGSLECLTHAEAMDRARSWWTHNRDIPYVLRICVVNERTGFTTDEISRANSWR
jgi:hypothetical protein